LDFKVMLTTFGLIFLAELGDKTQLATFAFSAESPSRLSVFIGSATALVLTSFVAVLFGGLVGKWIPANTIKIGAGILFILLGLWMVLFPGQK
jgi:putative Ca2+/H+ antiporter (TMEM165/GDT1 family)